MLTVNFSGYNIEKNEMGWACSTYGGDERRIQSFWWGNLREGDPLGRRSRRLEDNIKMDLQEVGCRVMD